MFPCLFTADEREHLANAVAAPPPPKRAPPLSYDINFAQIIASSALRDNFIQSRFDEDTAAWVASTGNPSSAKQFAVDLLTHFVSRTTANGVCFRGEMFVLSPLQFFRLLDCAVSGAGRTAPAIATSSATGGDGGGGVGSSAPVPHQYGHGGGAARLAANNNVSQVRAAVTGRYGGLPRLGDDDDDDDDNTARSGETAPLNARSNHHARATSEHDADAEDAGRMARFLHSRRNAPPPATGTRAIATMLDIGAGDGNVTKRLSPFFDAVSVTEDNTAMRLRLRTAGAGFSVFASSDTPSLLASGAFDLVACLNVLDRCDQPLTLLREIHGGLVRRKQQLQSTASTSAHPTLVPSPLLLLAVVLPWCPFVESGAAKVAPSQPLPGMEGGRCRDGATFEQSLDRLVAAVLEPMGFRVRCWTRVPYLSEGDAAFAYFALDDAVLVLEPV